MAQCQFSGALDMRQVGKAEEEAYAAAGTNLALSPPGRRVLRLQRAEAKSAQKTVTTMAKEEGAAQAK